MAPDPYRYFRVEARDLLEQMSKCILEVEKGEGTADLVSRLMRLAHTLKGAARVVKHKAIADRAHELEDVLGPFRDAASALPRERIEALLALVDAMNAEVSKIGQQPAVPGSGATASAPGDNGAGVATLQVETPQALRADIGEVDRLVEGIGETQGQLGTLRRGLGALDEMTRMAETLSAQLDALLASRDRAPLATTAALARALSTRLAQLDRAVMPAAERVDRELRQVRGGAERLRLLPASSVFTTLERTARDAAQGSGKRVVMVAAGGELRLDGGLLALVQGALVQLVRNAVAHGIEAEGERARAGKPTSGRVEVTVARQGDRAVFAVADDGRGLDLPAIRRAAERRGLAASRDVGADDLTRLLLAGGISTAAEVSGISGRGIGMDVVRDAAARLGGDVSVTSEAGRGATWTLSVPVSLAALEALLVEVDGRAVALPLAGVRRTASVPANDLVHDGDRTSVLVDGRPVPFVPLAEPLRVPPRNGVAARRHLSVVVLEGSGGTGAVAVDRLLGTANIVVHPVPARAPLDPVVMGLALDAENVPQLVLAIDALVDAVQNAARQRRSATAGQAKLPILIIDDSMTTRMLEQSILESAGYEVELASSAEEGMEKARRRRFGLFLVDVEMPGMDGFTFVAETRKDAELGQVPAFLVTSRNSPDDMRRGMEAGAAAHLIKSEFDQAVLLQKIRAVMG
jgi:two-component system chemotaxis sensor kinase CheA